MPTGEKIREWIVAVIVLLSAVCGAGAFIFQHFENHIQQLDQKIDSDHDKLADALGKIGILQQQMYDHTKDDDQMDRRVSRLERRNR